MSGTSQRFGDKKRGGSAGAVLPDGSIKGASALPQVNLLPDSVRSNRALRQTKLMLLAGLGAALIVAILGYVAAMLSAQSAQEDLEAAQDETTRLVQEQAKYAEVPQVMSEIQLTEQALAAGLSTDIDWAEAILQTLAILPPGSSLMSFDTNVMNPMLAPTVSADPLTTPGIGVVTLTHRSPTVPDTSTWLDAVGAIPGFVDARFTTQSIAEEDGEVYYEVLTTVSVTTDALTAVTAEGETE